MLKKVSFITLITIIFIGAVATLEVIHRQIPQEPPVVEAEHLSPLDISLKDDFKDDLETRTEEMLSDDLIY